MREDFMTGLVTLRLLDAGPQYASLGVRVFDCVLNVIIFG
jgi:hypothetical protein